MISFVHVVNPVKVPETSDLHLAQPVTFASMLAAKEAAEPGISVELCSVHYPEDEAVIPAGFTIAPHLSRSILDLDGDLGSRKLPLLHDILERAYEVSSADYMIYTNVDIGLQPLFYTECARLIMDGHDAFTITRRTLSGTYSGPEDLRELYAEPGTPHPGWDCFVYHRKHMEKLRLADIYLGIPPIGNVFLCNLMHFSEKFGHFKELSLTFHIGDDGEWKRRKNSAEAFSRRAGDVILSSFLTGRAGKRNPEIYSHWAANRAAMWPHPLAIIGKVIKRLRTFRIT